jgi:DNA-binding FadR family transcriptional regulator
VHPALDIQPDLKLLRQKTITAATIKHSTPRATAPPEKPLRSPRIAELVAGRIRKMIVRGELQPGDFLQPEAQLVERFSTSRATIREAICLLEAEQFLTVRPGSRCGAQVHLPTEEHLAKYAGFVLQAQKTTLADIYQMRAAIEPHAVWLLATRHAAADVAVLRAELADAAALQERDEVREFHASIARFHRSLVDLTASNTLRLVIAMIHEVIERHQVHVGGTLAPSEACQGLKSFWKLVDLIERGEAERAQSHWRQHIHTTDDAWLSAPTDSTLVDLPD